MKALTIATTIFLAAGPAGAATGTALSSLAASAPEARANGTPPAAVVTAPPAPVLKWSFDRSHQDPIGPWHFSYRITEGEDYWETTFAAKLAFKRGSYDNYSKTFKAVPMVVAQDLTDLQELDEVYSFTPRPLELLSTHKDWGFGQEAHFRFLNISYFDKSLSARACDWEGKCEPVVFADETYGRYYYPIKALYSDWKLHAQGFRVDVAGKKFYMVPQKTLELKEDDNNYDSFGLVLSEKAPLNPVTGVPQDYVELFRQDRDGNRSFKPRAYSLPTGLVFELADAGDEENAPSWTVREMQDPEVQDAMEEMLTGGRKAEK